LWLSVLAVSLPAAAAILVPGERGSFVFQDPGQFAAKPITVHYYRPRTAGPDASVLVAVHGSERNGKAARDHWVRVAETNRAVILAPEFDNERFPQRLFQLGGMHERDRSHWTFGIIERLFDQVRSEEGLTTSGYLLFGHSAGAQFVHRFVLMMEQPRLVAAVAANAGTYTSPAYPQSLFDLRYPWALDESMVDRPALKSVFARRLIVLLGEADTDTSAPDYPRSREASQFGATRFERGRSFYAKAATEAARLDMPLQWELRSVPGVGHNAREMARAAARLLFPAAP